MAGKLTLDPVSKVSTTKSLEPTTSKPRYLNFLRHDTRAYVSGGYLRVSNDIF